MVLIRAVLPGEYERVGDVTVTSYAASPGRPPLGWIRPEIREVVKRLEAAEIFVAVLDDRVVGDKVVGAVTYVSDPDSEWLEWTDPDEAQIRLLAVDTAAQVAATGEALVPHVSRRRTEQRL